MLAVTESGRTARMNGTKGTDHGTDHGTGTVVFIAGRRRRRRPGLTPGRHLDNRDLQPTRDLGALIEGLLPASSA